MSPFPIPLLLLKTPNGSLDPFGIVDSGGRYVWVNDASVRLFGYPREAVLGTHYRDHLLPEEVPGDTMRQALSGRASAVVRRLRCADGSVLILRTELLPLPFGYVLIHATDLTALYTAIDRERETSGMLRRAQEIGQMRSWALDLRDQTLRWIGHDNDIQGIPAGTPAPRDTAIEIVDPEDRAAVQALVGRAIRDGSAVEVVRAERADGGIRWTRLYAHAMVNEHTQQVTHIEGVAHDITEVREQDERYRELLEGVRVPMGIWWRRVGETPARIRYVNQALSEILREPADSLLNQMPGTWLVPEEVPAVTEHMTRVAAGERLVPLQMHLQRADRSLVTCLLVAAPITYERRPAIAAQFIDISEEVRLREIAGRAQAADLALAVAAGVAHDFNNIFTGLLGYLELAAELMDAATPEAGHVRSALLSARRAAALTRALRGYSNSAGPPPPSSTRTRSCASPMWSARRA